MSRMWHFTLPPIAYRAFLIAAIVLGRFPTASLFTIGAAALFLLLSRFTTPWDAVTFMAARKPHAYEQGAPEAGT